MAPKPTKIKMNKDECILVSIVTPAYNCQDFISESIQSVCNQTYQNWEMFIVDDFSSDGTIACIQNFVNNDCRIKLIQLPENSGAAIARNTAIEQAAGQYVAFLDSDDTWKPEKLEKQVAFMQDANIVLSYAGYELVNEQGEGFGEFVPPKILNYRNLLKTCSIGCSTAMYDISQLGKVYMPALRKRQDYGLWLKILKQTPEARGLVEPLAQYRIRKDSVSSNKFSAAKYQWHIYRDVERLGLLKSIYYFCYYAVNGLMKYR